MSDKKPILRCSRGCTFDPNKPFHPFHPNRYKKAGDRCGEELSYNVMDGTRYCRRILKAINPSQHERQ